MLNIQISFMTLTLNPYLWIVDKKTTNREYDGASFVDKKSTQNPKSWFLGMSGSVICGQKIHINFFEKIRKIGFWECHGASFVDKKSTLIFFLKIRKIGSWKCHGASYMGNQTTLISWNISLSACNVIFGRDCLCGQIWFT